MTTFAWQLDGEAVEIDQTEARKIAEERLVQEMEAEMVERRANRLHALAVKKLDAGII